MKRLLFGLAVLCLMLAGCGGQGTKNSTVTGTVTDINGNAGRNVRVSGGGSSTFTTTSGAFVLTKVREGEQILRAEIVQDGVRYVGENLARVFSNEQTQSVNIVIAPESQMAILEGRITDRNGRALQNARVFALGGGITSQSAITDREGRYILGGLVSGITYEVNAGGGGFSSDRDQIVMAPRERRTLNFVLGAPGGGALPAPTNLVAISWTSPAAQGRSRDANAYEQIKRLFDPRRSREPSRDTNLGNPIEVNLFWDAISSDNLLGYGIYRGRAGNDLRDLDFWREPLAGAYIDLDPNLNQNQTYSYAITSLTTRYPDPGTESDFSNLAQVTTLGDLRLLDTSVPLRFAWQGGSGATEYIVYLFDRFPGIGVDSIWNNANAPTNSLFLNYNGPALQIGRRYYYLVLGTTNGGDSRTISPVGEFQYQG